MTKPQKLAQQLMSAVLFIAVLTMLGWLSNRYKTELDWTAGHRNTLTEASVRQLASMHDPIKLTAFVYSAAENKAEVEEWVKRYQRAKKDISIEFIDPASHPEKVKEYNIERPGDIVVEYQGRRETLSAPALSESSITSALQRLSYSGDRFVAFLEGHGERSQFPRSAKDYDQFAQVLRDKGLKLQSLNLVKTPSIPDNTSLLVIASPISKPLDGEVKLIRDYVAGGGNLLWLLDPENPTIDDLAKDLGVTWQNGVAIFPNYQALGLSNPAIFVATAYPEESPVTRELNELTAFPLARSLTWDKNSGWTAVPMLVTDQAAWLETGNLGGTVSFDDKSGDIAGPLTLGLTLTRDIKAPSANTDANAKPADAAAKTPEASRQQRLGLVGDADFLSDSNLNQLGNKQLGVNLVQWLASRDAQLNIEIPKAPDRELLLPAWELWLLAGGFLVVLPAGLLGFGIIRWVVRRRA
jgi:ABC-type uncharacterized transport system involved in gliding motility auxiliary subunit